MEFNDSFLMKRSLAAIFGRRGCFRGNRGEEIEVNNCLLTFFLDRREQKLNKWD